MHRHAGNRVARSAFDDCNHYECRRERERQDEIERARRLWQEAVRQGRSCTCPVCSRRFQ